MKKNRIKKSLHKMKFPQMLFPFADPCSGPMIKLKGTKDNHLVFYFHKDGSRTQVHQNAKYLKHGIWRSWDKAGNLCKIIPYDKELQHGRQVHWYPDGSLQCIWNWHHGFMHGRWMEWYENGVTSFQGHYRHGKKHGKWWEWYENGRMKVAGDFDDGYAVDLTVWKPDGGVCQESGVSVGFGYWLDYNDDGEVIRRAEISNGEIDDDNTNDADDDGEWGM